MPAIELTDDQAVELIRQLPAETRLSVLKILARMAADGREESMLYAEEQARRLSRERGRDWDHMNDTEREAFVNELVHEGRACRR